MLKLSALTLTRLAPKRNSGSKLPLADKIDLETLLGPREELIVTAAFEILREVIGGVEIGSVPARDPYDEQVLLVGNTAFLIVDDFAVAVEGETVLDVAPHAKHGNRAIGRQKVGQPVGERAGRVGAIEEVDDAFGGFDLGDA